MIKIVPFVICVCPNAFCENISRLQSLQKRKTQFLQYFNLAIGRQQPFLRLSIFYYLNLWRNQFRRRCNRLDRELCTLPVIQPYLRCGSRSNLRLRLKVTLNKRTLFWARLTSNHTSAIVLHSLIRSRLILTRCVCLLRRIQIVQTT